MYKFLIFSLLSASATAINPIVPDCIPNFTTFFNNYANGSQVTIYQNYSDISGTRCGTLCNSDLNCTSFNYFPDSIFTSSSRALCQLISSPFNRSTLEDGTYMAFYLKSENSCDISHIKDIIIISSISVITLILIVYCTKSCRKRTRGYDTI
jgi:hypothetical protein